MASETSPSPLDEFPALKRWFQDQDDCSEAEPPIRFIFDFCHALDADPEEQVEKLVAGFGQFLARSEDPLDDFLEAEERLQGFEVPFFNVLSLFGEEALKQERGVSFQKAVAAMADETGVAVLRFLSAWAALNDNRYDVCIAECESVDEPYAPLFTLQGQALVEQGRAKEAVDVLNVAVKLAPGEILAWFQLAKANHVLDRFDPSWEALARCQELAPHSEEIALFQGLVAVSTPHDRERATQAWGLLSPHLTRLNDHPTAISTLMRLAFICDDKTMADTVTEKAAWSHLARDPAFIKAVPPLLRELDKRNWQATTRTFLDGMTAHSA